MINPKRDSYAVSMSDITAYHSWFWIYTMSRLDSYENSVFLAVL